MFMYENEIIFELLFYILNNDIVCNCIDFGK